MITASDLAASKVVDRKHCRSQFLIGGLSGITIITWIVFFPLRSWRDDQSFATFSKDCIISDLGQSWQVYSREPAPSPLHL